MGSIYKRIFQISENEVQTPSINNDMVEEEHQLARGVASLNTDNAHEGIILKSLMEECRDRTVVIVSHRESTMNAADTIFEM